MVLASQEIKQHIMLGANTKDFSHIVHILEDVDTENRGLSGSWFQETSKHGKSGCLTCAVVSEEGENLTIVHSHTCATDSGLIAELLDESPHSEAIIGLFLLFNGVWYFLKVFGILCAYVIIAEESLIFLVTSLSSTGSLAAEVPWLRYSELGWDNLITVEAETCPEHEVEEQHQKASSERVALINNPHRGEIKAIQGVEVVEENLLDTLIHANIRE